MISMPLQEGSGVAVSVDYFVPLSVTSRGNTYILLFDRFRRRAEMYAVTATECTADGTANILINRYFPLWACPHSMLSDNGFLVCPKLSHAVCKLLGFQKIATRSYHPICNGGVERKSRNDSNTGNGGQRVPKQLGRASPLRRICVQQFGQPCYWFRSERDPHG